MTNLNTNQLNVFLVAAECLNFTQAAHRLQVTQPSVSQHIQALEEHFGLPLFVRAGRSLELTAAGEVLVPLARELVHLGIHIAETMASLKGEVHGHLIIGCSTPTGRYILPKLLACFHRQYPQVRATCHVTSQAEALRMIELGKVHLVIASQPPFYQDIEFRRITTENVVLIASREHPWSEQSEIDILELCQADFILPDEGSDLHNALREQLAKRDFSIYQLRAPISLGSLEAIALSVQEGLGVAFIPELIYRRLVPDQVVPIRVRNLEIQREIFIGRNLRRNATAAQSAFWEFILAFANSGFEDSEAKPCLELNGLN